VVAQYRVDELLHRGILSAFTHEDPRKKDVRRQEVLLLAAYHTVITPYTGV